MIDVADLVKCSYSMEPNLTTTHNCASVVREVLIRLGYDEAAQGFPVLPEAALLLLSRQIETLPWVKIGHSRDSLREPGDIAVTDSPADGHLGVSILIQSRDQRVITALPECGVRIMRTRALKNIKSVYRPLR